MPNARARPNGPSAPIAPILLTFSASMAPLNNMMPALIPGRTTLTPTRAVPKMPTATPAAVANFVRVGCCSMNAPTLCTTGLRMSTMSCMTGNSALPIFTASRVTSFLNICICAAAVSYRFSVSTVSAVLSLNACVDSEMLSDNRSPAPASDRNERINRWS